MLPLTHQQIKKRLREFKATRPNIEIVFFLQNIDSPANVGHFFRLADAVGACEIILTGNTPTPDNNAEVKLTAMNNEQRVSFVHFQQFQDGVKYIKQKDYKIISLELTGNSILYTSLPKLTKICLVAGNETSGVYPYVLKNSDYIVHVPMYGKNFSLNVHVAVAIVVYDFLIKNNS